MSKQLVIFTYMTKLILPKTNKANKISISHNKVATTI
jgi:hypothetical protein